MTVPSADEAKDPLLASDPTRGSVIAGGWAALSRGAWDGARARFTAAVTQQPSGSALEGLSWAAWWLDDAQAVFDARERAFLAYRACGDAPGAARMAMWLGTDHVDFRDELAVGQGWLARARRILAAVPPGPEHGWLAVHEAEKHLFANDTQRAKELGAVAVKLGRQLGLVDLEMMGLATEGLALVTEGSVADGIARMDEAATAAMSGEFAEMLPTMWCCCYMIYGCERLRDYARAAQWCKRFEQWSERRRIQYVNRLCRAHYAGILVRRGAWELAEVELTESARRLAQIRPPMAAEALVRLAELRRRQGRLDDAERIFLEVEQHPLALLGLGEVCLDRGDPHGARHRAEQYLRETPELVVMLRAAGLELLVRALAVLGDGSGAAGACEELRAIAAGAPAEPLRASANVAAGAVAMSVGDPDAARAWFEDATRAFLRAEMPYEAALARVELARALATLGRGRDAAREARAASTSLDRIGAGWAAAQARTVASGVETAGSASPITARETEVLRLVAAGKSDRSIAAELVVSEHTVHRHVANILAKLCCSSRSAAVAEALRRGLI